MSLLKLNLYFLLGELEWNAFRELNDVADYVYKSPRLLEHEKDLERWKLATYFPEGGPTADLREHLESVKLNQTFPRLIATANLFLSLSVFENHVFSLLRVLQEQNPTVPREGLGQGVAAHLKAMKAYGAEPYHQPQYEQVLVALSIRNCLMHAKGSLAVFRQAEALRTQVNHRRFLGPDLRKRRFELGRSPAEDEVMIEGTGLDERLVITNSYAHIACSDLRDYFCALCGTLNPNTALRPMPSYMHPRALSTGRRPQGRDTRK
ncbi:hypothetical protein [Terriglobus sp. ADX1]|uniref:hypothetical protein n=1 Tax=Terriglobus sp. ADX1 TaxID=2794063 RepID=UPI002FE5E54A